MGLFNSGAVALNLTTLETLDQWLEEGWLKSVDRAFASFLAQEVPTASPRALIAAALVSYQFRQGHTCLDLQQLANNPARTLGAQVPATLESLANIPLEAWQNALMECPQLCTQGVGNTPLVLVGPRLYLRRNWQYEVTVRSQIFSRLQHPSPFATDAATLRPLLDQLFPPSAGVGNAPDWQKLACGMAALRSFSIVTGGPGTGKTTTVVKLLALLQASRATPLTIRLAAPTGKAAARLSDSITGAIGGLKLDAWPNSAAIIASIPSEVTTLHRLLGRGFGTRQSRYGEHRKLPLDLLVIDEASMVSLDMMAEVMHALPQGAGLILLGDKDQLASVEAGAILGELCRYAQQGRYHQQTVDDLEALTGTQIPPEYLDANGTLLDQAIVMLRHSYRFSANKGIGQLAFAVNTGDAREVTRLLSQESQELTLLESGNDASFYSLVVNGANADGTIPRITLPKGDQNRAGYRAYLTKMRSSRPGLPANSATLDRWAKDVLNTHNQFQVLAAVRQGPWGTQELNQAIADRLYQLELISRPDGWYEGRPIMVTRNDYTLGLMNGDVGITLNYPGDEPSSNRLRVAFMGADGIKWVSPSRLANVETVFALTVHKSQGSEFTHTLLVLPDTFNPVLTRELLYTAITRSRTWLSLCNPGGAYLLEHSVKNRVVRASGLLDGENGG